jgi:transposase
MDLSVAFTAPGIEAQTKGNDRPSCDSARSVDRMGRRRLWSAEQRAQIVLQSLKGKEPNTQICRRYQISEPTLYKWRQLFLEGGMAFLSGTGSSSVKQLQEENRHLREMLLDLSIAYHRLRSARSKSGEASPIYLGMRPGSTRRKKTEPKSS